MRIINEESYVPKAENVIKELCKKAKKDRSGNPNIVTTSQLRNLLAMCADIYNMVIVQTKDELSDEIKGKIEYLKIRMVYDAGRDDKVKKLVEEAELLDCINEIKGSKRNYILFNRYMEALVAYRKFNVERDE
ncbi:MAG: type III-A CRISPR-associated protein Csm2 [Lachnospiraceae bacterium]|nr:type III-A CRISPR-associated protein Csm2 [Lachnospiraceae bacterium]